MQQYWVGRARVKLYNDLNLTDVVDGSEKDAVVSDSTLTYSVTDVPAGTSFAEFSLFADGDGNIPCEKRFYTDAIYVGGGTVSKNTEPLFIDKAILRTDPWVLVKYADYEDPFVYRMPVALFTKNLEIEINSAYRGAGSNDGNDEPTELSFECNVDVAAGMWAFFDCSVVSFPFDHLVTAGYGAFNSSGIKEVDLTGSCVAVLDYCFAGCSSLTKVVVPGSVKVIKSGFLNCTSLTDVKLNEGIEDMDSAFDGCAALESVVVPSSVRNMNAAFAFCDKLKVYVPKGTLDAYRAFGDEWAEGGYNLEEKEF